MSVYSKRVLLIEDEEHIRVLVSAILRRKGYEIVVTCDGLEGMAALRSTPDFDLIITDLQMPGLGGIKLIQALRAGYPQIPIIVISAYATADWAHEALTNAVVALPKPFSHKDLITVVDGIL
jgi:CheY-like chemotaxis protein